MAYLVDNKNWESVYQIETSDPVEGGPGGVTNLPAQNLTNRTAYLKDKLEDLKNLVTETSKTIKVMDEDLKNINSGVQDLNKIIPNKINIEQFNTAVNSINADISKLEGYIQTISADVKKLNNVVPTKANQDQLDSAVKTTNENISKLEEHIQNILADVKKLNNVVPTKANQDQFDSAVKTTNEKLSSLEKYIENVYADVQTRVSAAQLSSAIDSTSEIHVATSKAVKTIHDLLKSQLSVKSINGRTGDVTLTAHDLGALTSSAFSNCLLEQNGYLHLPNGLIIQWGVYSAKNQTFNFLVPYQKFCVVARAGRSKGEQNYDLDVTYTLTSFSFSNAYRHYIIAIGC